MHLHLSAAKRLPNNRQEPYHRHQNQKTRETNVDQNLNTITESIIGYAYTPRQYTGPCKKMEIMGL
jgi:hypothetical protein